jgi:hypothetical protein
MRLILFIFMFPFAAQAACDFPVPNFKISEFAPSSISKASFDQAMDVVERAYAPIFENLGCPLNLIRSWSNGEVNAQAWQEGGKCNVEMFGGFARYPGMTKNAVIAVACHEIGHHLGGTPFYTGENLSVEGQADYYATLTCMKRLGIPSANASMVLATAMARLGGEHDPSRSTRATERVTQTLQTHPRAQCRLDTYDAGAGRQSRPRCWFYR